MHVVELWSGGQAGVDRAVFDLAIELRIPYKGWIPKDRAAEDGPIPARYEGLVETVSANPAVRTKRNVRDSDATLVITSGPITGGTALARDTALRLGKPVLVVDLSRGSVAEAATAVVQWLDSLPSPLRLNVAGPRASHWPDAYEQSQSLVRAALAADVANRSGGTRKAACSAPSPRRTAPSRDRA